MKQRQIVNKLHQDGKTTEKIAEFTNLTETNYLSLSERKFFSYKYSTLDEIRELAHNKNPKVPNFLEKKLPYYL